MILRHIAVIPFLTTTTTSALLLHYPHSPRYAHSASLRMISSSNDLYQAKQQIKEAIATGAPAYNSGDVQKCASVYMDTAARIIPIVPTTFKSKLQTEVEDSKAVVNENNPDAKAWALRRIFDSILEFIPPIIPSKQPLNVSYEPFTSTQIGSVPMMVMDNVMGGVSTGSWNAESNTFQGVTSTLNNGGFASIRWRFNTPQNWVYAKGIYIKGLKHSNPLEHTFSILLKDDMCERVRLANYKAVFANPIQNDNNADDETLYIPFSVFNQMEQMGRALVGSPAFNPLAVTEIGIMAIKPTVVGEFHLEFSEWGLYTESIKA